ncbi:MAG: STAS domain-containing protein [Gammaproteobacteria bacterium]|nr:STAS domain-containing protein [Gammaproteobacteria bacterium]
MTEVEVSLSGRLTINEAEEQQQEWVRQLAECEQLIINICELTVVDVTGLQLLIALRRSAKQAGKTVRLAQPPEGALLAALVKAGFRQADDQESAGNRDRFWWGG